MSISVKKERAGEGERQWRYSFRRDLVSNDRTPADHFADEEETTDGTVLGCCEDLGQAGLGFSELVGGGDGEVCALSDETGELEGDAAVVGSDGDEGWSDFVVTIWYGMSTAVHARALAPDNVSLFVEDASALANPDSAIANLRYPLPERVLVLFPAEDAKPLSQLSRKSFDVLIVLDGTWQQAKAMYTLIKHLGFQPVTIGFRESPTNEGQDKASAEEPNQDHGEIIPVKNEVKEPNQVTTQFWRYQSLGQHCLATIEAVYYFYREYFECYERRVEDENTKYDGRYDGLMFYFKQQYRIVQEHYRRQPGLRFTSKKKDAQTYVKYSD
ncbi:DTW domain-containing protein 1 [Entophlyctis sp. JEL0112]|nr:DTW domain-containing protein 1 [Entophlyctis sp. JEL0112]